MATNVQQGTLREARPPRPIPYQVAPGDIVAALRAGVADFTRAPLFGLFFGGVYALGGLAILALLAFLHMPWMIIPLAVGFPLIGPFVAAGLYEVSRVLARGGRPRWREVLLVVVEQRNRQLGWMAFVVLFIFWVWIYQVRLLLALFLGFKSFSSIAGFATVITTTSEGLTFLAVGTAVGAFLAFILFCATAISMPLLLDRDIDFVTAMITSFRVVFLSPAVMIGWGVTVAIVVILAMLPAFLGLLIALPVLGHTTWHLYERAVGWKD
jgi:uncharacterized membrane protein